MTSEAILLRAEARKRFQAGDKRFEGHMKMSLDALKDLIAGIDSGKVSAPKQTATTNGAQKTTSSVPAAKSIARKPPKGAATGEAKRPATVATPNQKKGLAAAQKVAAVTDARLNRPTKPKPAPKPEVAKRKPRPVMQSNGQGRVTKDPKGGVGFRAPLDHDSIDWDAETTLFKRGARKIIMDSLRENKGDFAKVYKALHNRVEEIYPYVKADLDKHLRWHIARTAFDFALATGQHEPGTRVGYGEKKKAAKKGAARKGATASKKAQATQTPTRTTASPQRGSQRATAAPKGKPAPKKPAASSGRSVSDWQ